MAKAKWHSDEASREWWTKVSDVALAFERRWTMAHLRRIDGELAGRLMEQKALFDRACLQGSVGDIEEQGGGMVRGWLAAIKAMGEAPDSAYQIGRDTASGLTVAIGENKAAASRVVELFGGEAIHITPDEVATMFASVEAFKSIGAIKQKFPGAELIGRYQNEGS